MAITRNDCVLLLAELSDKYGTDTKSQMMKLFQTSSGIDLEVLKYINDTRQLPVAAFYEKIRKSYNDKKSKLFINIVKSDESENPKNVLTTLSAMLTQILLFAEDMENTEKTLFLNHCRAYEISLALGTYFKNYDLVPAIKLLRLIKADLKTFQAIGLSDEEFQRLLND